MRAGLALILAVALTGCDRPTDSLREPGPGQLTAVEKKRIEGLTIRVGGDANYPPFIFKGPDGKPTGLSVEFFEETARRLDVKYEYTFIGQRAEMLKMLEAKQIDMTLGSRTSATRPYLIVTQPYEYSKGTLLVNKGTNLESIIKVGAGRGYASVVWLKSNKPEYTIVEVDDDEACIKNLQVKHVDACIMGREQVYYWADHLKLNVKQFDLLPVEYNYFLSFGVHSDNVELVDILIKGLASIPQSRQQEILKKWLKEPFL